MADRDDETRRRETSTGTKLALSLSEQAMLAMRDAERKFDQQRAEMLERERRMEERERQREEERRKKDDEHDRQIAELQRKLLENERDHQALMATMRSEFNQQVSELTKELAVMKSKAGLTGAATGGGIGGLILLVKSLIGG